jgi:hypothetical protein
MNYIVLTVRDCNIPKFRRVSEIDSENHLESKFRKYIDVLNALTFGQQYIDSKGGERWSITQNM